MVFKSARVARDKSCQRTWNWFWREKKIILLKAKKLFYLRRRRGRTGQYLTRSGGEATKQQLSTFSWTFQLSCLPAINHMEINSSFQSFGKRREAQLWINARSSNCHVADYRQTNRWVAKTITFPYSQRKYNYRVDTRYMYSSINEQHE